MVISWADHVDDVRLGSGGLKIESISISLLGGAGTGKTTLKRVFDGKKFDDKPPITVGANLTVSKVKIDNSKINLRVFDIAGQESFANIRKNFMKNTDGAILIFDITDSKTFDILFDWLLDYWNANPRYNQPVLLVGNKADKDNDRKIKLSDVKKFIELIENNRAINPNIVGYIETSAKTGKNVSKIFDTVISEIINKKFAAN